MSENGCLKHGEIEVRVDHLEQWKTTAEGRFQEGEKRMDSLESGRVENAADIKNLCLAVRDTNSSIKDLMDRLEKWFKFGLSSAIGSMAVIVAIIELVRRW